MVSQAGVDAWQWLGGADNVTATLLALGAIFVASRAALRRTAFRRRVFRSVLDSLSVGVNQEYVSALLGAPAFGRLDGGGSGDLVWVSRHGYVHVIFVHGAAEQVAITVTDPWLRYDVSKLSLGVLKGRLGHKVASEAPLSDLLASVGARRVSCVVSWWAGNPGGYLYHSLAYNDASGLGRFPDCVLASGQTAYGSGLYEQDDVPAADAVLADAIRGELLPNTLIVTRQPELLQQSYFPGVDLDVVRLLPREGTWAETLRNWRLRRRWEAAIR